MNVCSAAGLIAGPSMGPYNGSKFAFEAFSDTMRREMADWGVNVREWVVVILLFIAVVVTV